MRNTARNAGMASRAMKNSPTTSTGTMTTKVSASLPPIMNAMMMEKIIISGARTAMRMHIMYAICTF